MGDVDEGVLEADIRNGEPGATSWTEVDPPAEEPPSDAADEADEDDEPAGPAG